MLSLNDSVTFNLINIIDDEGVLINKFYKLPLTEVLELPENISEISLFEGHQGKLNEGFISMKFYVGNRMKLNDVCKDGNKINFIANNNFNSVHDDALVRISEDGRFNIIRKLDPNDVVVPDVNSLIEVLYYVSEEVKTITNSVNRVKELHK
jgi:hypothetical protein